MLREPLGKIIKIPLRLYLNLYKAVFFLFENDITEKQKNFSLSDFFLSVTSLSERMQQSCIMKQNCSEKCSQTSELMN